MCGIAGGVGQNISSMDISKMASSLSHRGPDESSLWESSKCKLAMTRLSILDIEFGKQPFRNETAEIICIFNGEIFNHKKLRQNLINNHIFISDHADGEILPHLYEDYGIAFPNELDGMFAIAIWDEQKSQLFLARDHFGIKPLYYYINNNSLYFASEIKAFFKLDFFEKDLDTSQINNYFQSGHSFAPNTIFKDIKQLQPAQSLIFNINSGVSIQNYWNPKPKLVSNNPVERAETLYLMLNESVESRMSADVEVGCLLSGGVDSSIIALLASKVSKKTINTYSLVYEEDNLVGKSEDQYWAKKISEQIGSKHTEIEMSPVKLMENFLSITLALDEPFAGVISTFFISQEVSKELKVVLSGDGSDEMFGSYFFHRLAAYVDSPEVLRLSSNNLGLSDSQYTEVQKIVGETNRRMYFLTNSEHVVEKFFSTIFLNILKKSVGTPRNGILGEYNRIMNLHNDSSNLKNSLWLDFNESLPNEVLLFVDRLSMAWSLEIRPPYLSKELYEYSLGLMNEDLISDFTEKDILKRAFNGMLPDELLFRKKEGFILPLANWLAKEMYPWMILILDENRISKHGYLNSKKVSELAINYKQPNYKTARLLWRFISFQIWWENLNGK